MNSAAVSFSQVNKSLRKNADKQHGCMAEPRKACTAMSGLRMEGTLLLTHHDVITEKPEKRTNLRLAILSSELMPFER